MSYILDALKKSEKERQRGAVPDVLTVQEAALQEPKKRLLWSYIVIAVLLLNTGFFIWWSIYTQSRKPIRVEQSVVQKQDNQAKAAVSVITLDEKKTARKEEPPASNPITKSASSAPAVAEEKPAELSKSVVEKAAPAEIVIRHESPAPAPTQPVADKPASDPKPVEAVIPPPENKIYNVTELPPALRQSLPQLTISTHIHSSDPASRLIRINGQTLHEGDDLSAGLKLVEIASDGVIFGYQNYRFRIGLR